MRTIGFIDGSNLFFESELLLLQGATRKFLLQRAGIRASMRRTGRFHADGRSYKSQLCGRLKTRSELHSCRRQRLISPLLSAYTLEAGQLRGLLRGRATFAGARHCTWRRGSDPAGRGNRSGWRARRPRRLRRLRPWSRGPSRWMASSVRRWAEASPVHSTKAEGRHWKRRLHIRVVRAACDGNRVDMLQGLVDNLAGTHSPLAEK